MVNFVQVQAFGPEDLCPGGAGENFNHPVRSAGPMGQADNHEVFRGLKFEPNAGIGQKEIFPESLIL